jgi:trehalose 6-phosphate synthase
MSDKEKQDSHSFISCDREIHSENRGDEIIQVNSHRVRIDSFVIGINPQKFDDALKAPDVVHKVKELEQIYHDKMVIVGVDRLDHAKGLIQKLTGYELLLKNHPELRKKITLIQVVVPSREDVKEYQELETELGNIVGRICGVYS